MRPTAVLVRFRPGAAASETGKAHRQAGGSKLKEIPGTGVDVVNVPRDTVQQKIASYRANPNVDYAEPDFYRVLIIPDKGNEPGPSAGGVITGREYFEEHRCSFRRWLIDRTTLSRHCSRRPSGKQGHAVATFRWSLPCSIDPHQGSIDLHQAGTVSHGL
jgi:hypothetical protein